MQTEAHGLGWWAQGFAVVLGALLLAVVAVLGLLVVTTTRYLRLRGESLNDRLRREGGIS